MVSKTLAALDAWLALAEEVLAEQDALPNRKGGLEEPRQRPGPHDHRPHDRGRPEAVSTAA
jgi:hypothetical protein